MSWRAPVRCTDAATAPACQGQVLRLGGQTYPSRRHSARGISSTTVLGCQGHRAISSNLGAAVPGSLLETLPAGTAARCGQDRNDMPLPIGSATTERCWSKRYGSWTDQSVEFKSQNSARVHPNGIPK